VIYEKYKMITMKSPFLNSQDDVIDVQRVSGSKTERFTLHSKNLVVGDIIYIKKNTIIPADCILLESRQLTVIQGYLTGSLNNVVKEAYDYQKSFVYKTTICTSGTATAVVVAVGANTQQLLLENFDKVHGIDDGVHVFE
jgi:P-type E1-E2 ATPase